MQGLSRVRDGLLVGEIDLNLVRQIRDKWSFPVSVQVEYRSSLHPIGWDFFR